MQNTERLEGMDFFSAKEKWMRPLAVPKEKLEKHFRWFYTYYTYTCDFQEIKDKGPIPMDKYLSKAEQLFLLQGKSGRLCRNEWSGADKQLGRHRAAFP